jgi:pilus assembly protein Flp/PilA
MFECLKAFLRDQEGATMPEYAIMVLLIALVCIAAVTLVGTATQAPFTNLAPSL